MREKLSHHLVVAMGMAATQEQLPVIVEYSGPSESVRAFLQQPEARHFHLTPFAALSMTPGDIRKVTKDPRIVKIWRDSPIHTCLDRSTPVINAPQVWQAGFTGRGVKVAIVDTGVDVNHPALAGRVVATHDVTGEGFGDANGHGTHVAGIVASGDSRYRGVAPEASLLAAKVMGAFGSGSSSWAMAGVEWAVENGAQVINLSLGSDGANDGTDPLSRTCDAAVGRGIVVCVAGGNAGPLGGSVGSPGCARQVITIGTVTDDDKIADFSSRGPTSDGRTKPDLLFPGYNITSLRAGGTHMGNSVGDLFTEASGSSMACPHASGAAALLLQAKPGLSPAQVKELLAGAAVDLGSPPNVQGAGRADVYAALRGQINPRPPQPAPSPGTPPSSPGKGCLPSIFWVFTK
ncbi:MAG: S8 family peptidase [Dehalococcoidia bacterium]|nr:S8 family peptidase [Dehalococcoidia bacterium]